MKLSFLAVASVGVRTSASAASAPSKTCAKVTLVGTGAAGPTPGRVGPCTMIQVGRESENPDERCTDRSLIFDLGRGAVTRLLELDGSFDFRKIDAVFASHSHQDHVLNMGNLAYFHWFGYSDTEVEMEYQPLRYIVPFAPSNGTTLESLEIALDFLQADMALRVGRPPARLNIETFDTALGEDPVLIYDEGGVEIYAVSVTHFAKEAVSYHVSIEGVGVIVLSQDINDEGGPYIQKFKSLSEEVDILVHEVTLYNYRPVPGEPSEGGSKAHTMPPRVVENAHELNAKLLALTHFLPSPGRPDSMGPVPNPPYNTEDDFLFAMAYEGFKEEVVVADDLTAIYLFEGGETEVFQTTGSGRFYRPAPTDYVSYRELITGQTPAKSPGTAESSKSKRAKSNKSTKNKEKIHHDEIFHS